MGQIFHYDSPVVHTINKIVDLVILNLLFLLCCIPIVTIGAAQTALYTAVYKRIFHDLPLWRSYWMAFFANLKQATILWLIAAVIVAAGITGIFVYISLNAGKLLIVLHGLLLLAGTGAAFWFFPLQARFENRIANTVFNAFYCSMTHLPRTMCGVLLKLLPVLLFYVFPSIFIYLLPFMAMLWFSLSDLLVLHLLGKPLSKMEKMAENNDSITRNA